MKEIKQKPWKFFIQNQDSAEESNQQTIAQEMCRTLETLVKPITSDILFGVETRKFGQTNSIHSPGEAKKKLSQSPVELEERRIW